MNSALEILRRERDEAAEQIRVLRTRIKDLDAAINLLEGQPISPKPSRMVGDLKQSVLKKLDDAGADGGTPKELADALTEEGRPTSDASISSTLSRLKGENKVYNRSGRWFAASEGSQPQSPSATSGSIWDGLDEEIPF